MSNTNGAVQDRQSRHKANIHNARPVFSNEFGSISALSTEHLPMLKNLSLQLVELEPKALLEPKWYSNCNMVGYVLEGKTLVYILDTASEMAATAVEVGQMFHVRSGALFNIENISKTKVKVLLCPRHESPKEFYLSSTGAAFTDAVLANTFDVEASIFKKTERSTKPKMILSRSGDVEIPRTALWPGPHRFEIEEMQPPTAADGIGSAKKARSQYWKILNNIVGAHSRENPRLRHLMHPTFPCVPNTTDILTCCRPCTLCMSKMQE